MSKAANMKKEGRESAFARRRREKEEFQRMLEEAEKAGAVEREADVETKLAEEARMMAAAKNADAIDDVADEVAKRLATQAQAQAPQPQAQATVQVATEPVSEETGPTMAQRMYGIKSDPSNKALSEQISGNTKMIRELTGQIGDLAGGVKVLAGTVAQHDQVLAAHGQRISALERQAGILEKETDPEPERVVESEPGPVPVQSKAEEPKPEAKQSSRYGYLYFPIDSQTGKTRWDLPFGTSVDAADLAIANSWRRRLFVFDGKGKVVREATPEEASKFSCGGF